MDLAAIRSLLGDEAALLDHPAKVSASTLSPPGPDFVSRVLANSDRKPGVLVNLQRMFSTGRLAGTGYVMAWGRATSTWRPNSWA